MFSRATHTLLWHVALFLSLWSGPFMTRAAMLNTPSIPASITQVQNVTISSSLANFPPDFKAIIQEPRGPKLLSILCLEVAIHVIGEKLALEDFTGQITAQRWSQNNILISVSTEGVTGNTIERRCVIWGIFDALTQMVREKDFRSAIFRLEWRGVLVGTLAFHPGDLSGIVARSNSANVSRLSLPLTSNSMSSNDSALFVSSGLGEPTLETRFFWLGGRPTQPLDKYGIYMNLIGTLMASAEHFENQIIREPFALSVGNYGVQVVTGGATSPQPPTRPPYLKYRWVIKAVTVIPRILASLEASAAFRVEMLLDKVPFGMIRVEPVRFMDSSAPLGSLLSDIVDVATS